MKKILSLLVVGIVIFAGCSTSGESAGDGKLVVWSFYEGAIKLAADHYAEESGTEVEFVTVGWEDYKTKLNTVLGTSDAPDVVIVERSFMGNYITTDNFISFDELLEGDENFEAYKENTATSTKGPGIVDDQIKAIGWENTASAFFYRSDLAEQCLGISSVEEMEAATPTLESYNDLYEQLKSSSDENCSAMSVLGFPDYQTGLLQQAKAYEVDLDNNSYTITKELGDALDEIKAFNDSGLVYSPSKDKTQMTAGNQKNLLVGNIQPAWGIQVALEFNQPGQWAIADTPIDFSAGGSFIAATSNADKDLTTDFLNATMLNEQWIIDNMESFGLVGNDKITSDYLETVDGSNEYFGGQNTTEKLSEINQEIDYYVPVSPYDSGIGTSIDEIVTAYAIDGTISTTDDAKTELQSKINDLYPDLEVIIE